MTTGSLETIDFWCIHVNDAELNTNVSIILITFSLLALAVNVFVGTFAVVYLQRMAKLHRLLKWLFYAIYIASFISEFAHLMAQCFCLSFADHVSITIQLITIHVSFYCISLLLVLSTLVARLHITFSDSIYKPTKCQLALMFVLTLLAIFGVIFSAVAFVAFSPQLVVAMSCIGCTMYAITSAYGIGLFVHCLMKFVKEMSVSMRNMNNMHIMDEDGIALTKNQMRFIHQTSRYLSLLVLAIISSLFAVLMLGLQLIVNKHELTVFIKAQMTFDITANLVVLCLQYPFANKVYHRLCGWNQHIWDRILQTNTQKYLVNKKKG